MFLPVWVRQETPVYVLQMRQIFSHPPKEWKAADIEVHALDLLCDFFQIAESLCQPTTATLVWDALAAFDL